MDNFVSKIIRLKFNQKQKSERSKANQSYSNLLVEEIYVTSPSVNLRFLGANKCRIKDEGRPPYTCYIFRKTVFHIAMRRSVADSRGPRTSVPRIHALLRVGRGWTRSNTVKRAYASLEKGRRGHVRAPDPDIRVESRSNRRKRGQTRAKPWLTKEEANCMYIRGLEDTYTG